MKTMNPSLFFYSFFIVWTLFLGVQVEARPPLCKKFYGNLLDDNRIDMLIVFGYKDSRPHRFVGDRHERLILVQNLMRDCTLEEPFLCGFSRSEDDANHFYRKLKWKISKRVINIQLDILDSSVGPDDQENRKDAYQQKKSQFTQSVFRNSFNQYEVVFYNGHSRAGGGPDFFPPTLQAVGDNIDFTFYKKYQPGFKDILDNLDKKSKTISFGLFSCASSKYFSKKIKEIKNDIVMFSSPYLLYYTDANENLYQAMRGVIAEDCTVKLNKALRADKKFVGSRVHM